MPRVYKRKYRKKKRMGKALATKKYVTRLLRRTIETKYHDASYDNAVTASGTIVAVPLTAIPLGTTDYERIGDKTTIRSIKIRLQFTIATGDAYNMLRLIIFQWYPNSSQVTPVVSNILASIMGSSDSYLSFYVHDLQNQYHVLYDKTMYVDNVRNQQYTLIKKLKLKYAKKTLNFLAGTTEASNHVYVLLLSDSTAATHPEVSYFTRVWYDDS